MKSIGPTKSSKGTARAAGGVSNHDSRTGDDPRQRAAAGDPDVKPCAEVHDALKRRCLYQWIDATLEKELAIVRERIPHAPVRLAEQVTALVQELRRLELYKVPGVSETLDWVAALIALDGGVLDAAPLENTLGVVLKAKEDIDAVRGERLGALLARVSGRR
jgi:MoxR-like ATPase